MTEYDMWIEIQTLHGYKGDRVLRCGAREAIGEPGMPPTLPRIVRPWLPGWALLGDIGTSLDVTRTCG